MYYRTKQHTIAPTIENRFATHFAYQAKHSYIKNVDRAEGLTCLDSTSKTMPDAFGAKFELAVRRTNLTGLKVL